MSRHAGVRTLILLRHGQTEWNATDRMQGQIDTDLTELGRRQAKEAARELVSRNAIAIVSSDLRRAFDTASALAEHTTVPVVKDARLRETDLGDWEGLTHLDVDADYPGARVAWRLDATYTPPGGESKLRGRCAVTSGGTRIVCRPAGLAGPDYHPGGARRADRRPHGRAARPAAAELACPWGLGQHQLGAAEQPRPEHRSTRLAPGCVERSGEGGPRCPLKNRFDRFRMNCSGAYRPSPNGLSPMRCSDPLRSRSLSSRSNP